MIEKKPYDAGEIRRVPNKGWYMIVGHIWWPVEKRNAYHCIKVHSDGTPTQDEPVSEYIWDHTDGKWPLAA